MFVNWCDLLNVSLLYPIHYIAIVPIYSVEQIKTKNIITELK